MGGVRPVCLSRKEYRGVVNGKTGEGGAFSKPEEQFGEKSMFNKEKYLPLARDLPVPISHYCCQVMKKGPMKAYQRKNHLYPYLGTLAEESRVRKQAWIRHGCNAFESKNPTSQPLSFWTEQDILHYIVNNGLEIASVYGDIVSVDADGWEYEAGTLLDPKCKLQCSGCDRTGCMFCAFGFHNEKGTTRFQRLAFTHPRQYEFCIGGGQWVDNPAYDPAAPEYDGEWKNWNPKKIWVPSKKGLGMGKVFDMVNEIYGKDFYRYD
jgi:3'-phosphoadenosine 5'-phosphosulfate sulfotransferase (PAPS reductase)/FAD synthetase